MPVIYINDYQDPAIDVFARLNERMLLHYYEPSDGLFIAESPIVIQRALEAGYEPVSLLMEEKHITGKAKDILSLCHADVPVYTASPEVLEQITGFALTRGVLCAMRRRVLPKTEDVCRNATRIVVLEDVMNPTNVGAIFRSAAALGMDAVLLTPACADPLYRRASRVSMGTVFQIPWTYIGEIPADWPHPGMKRLADMGFATAAMALHGNPVSLRDPVLASEKKLALILGTEGEGLKDSTIANCTYNVKIPMFYGVDSLNVAAASAVAFYELGRKA